MGAQAVLDGLADLAAVWAAGPRPGPHQAAARRCLRVDRKQEAHAAVRDEIEALLARERPGWRVAEVV